MRHEPASVLLFKNLCSDSNHYACTLLIIKFREIIPVAACDPPASISSLPLPNCRSYLKGLLSCRLSSHYHGTGSHIL